MSNLGVLPPGCAFAEKADWTVWGPMWNPEVDGTLLTSCVKPPFCEDNILGNVSLYI